MSKSPLYLIDSSIYVFRAWFTLPDSIVDGEGHAANAVYGFTDFVYRFLDEVRPEYLVFTFDESLTSSFRNDIYPDYKANREAAPEDLKRQFRLCREFVRAIGLTELGSDRYEADDLIGSIAAQKRQTGQNITVVTADKDLTQLLGEGDLWWDFAKDNKLGPKQVLKKFGVKPEQIADQLAIAGDAVDNIPGVPGIGMATAAKLLTRFGSLNGLLANIDHIHTSKLRGAQRLQNLVQEHQDTIKLSAMLTPIHCDAELPEPLVLGRQKPQPGEPATMFDALGFARLRRDRWTALLQTL